MSLENSKEEEVEEVPKYGKYQNLYEKIETSLHELNYERAIIQTKKLLFFFPDDVDLYQDLAKYYLQIYDISTATTYIKKAMLLAIDSNTIKHSLNDILFAQGIIKLIVSNKIEFDYEFLAQMRKNMKATDFYYFRAKAFLALNLVEDCIKDLNKLLLIDPQSEHGLILLGKVLMSKGRKKEGENLMWRANVVNPNNEEIKHFTKLMKCQMDEVLNKANIYILKGRLKLGLLLAFKALNIFPNHPEALLLRSSVYKSMGLFNESIADLNLAKERCNCSNIFCTNPNLMNYLQESLSGIYNDISVKQIANNSFNEALHFIEEAIKNQPNDFNAHLNKGDCFMKMKDVMGAKEEYMICYNINSKSGAIRGRLANVYYKLAILSYNSKDYVEALQLLSEAVKFYDKFDVIFVLKARTEVKLGMVQDAFNDASLAYLINPSNQDAIEIRKFLS